MTQGDAESDGYGFYIIYDRHVIMFPSNHRDAPLDEPARRL